MAGLLPALIRCLLVHLILMQLAEQLLHARYVVYARDHCFLMATCVDFVSC